MLMVQEKGCYTITTRCRKWICVDTYGTVDGLMMREFSIRFYSSRLSIEIRWLLYHCLPCSYTTAL